MTQEPDRVIEESQLREVLLKSYQLKCAEVESLTARLAAQSGYAENEAQADPQEALIAQYDAIMASVGQVNETIPVDVYEIRAEFVAAIANHDPRKGAE